MEKQKEVPTTSKTKKDVKDSLNKTTVKHEGYTAEIVRDHYGKVDPFYLSKKDPNFQYRFLRDEHKNISIKTGNLLFQKGGWQLVPREHLLKLGLKDKLDISPDGYCRRGDTILAYMPMKLFKEKEAYKIKVAKEPIDRIKKRTKDGDPNNAELVGLGHRDMKGLQTKEQLKMK